MQKLISILHETGASLVIMYKNGEIKTYFQNRVNDLKDILRKDPNALNGAKAADKVVGKLAASLFTVGKVEKVHADVLSSYGKEVFERHNIPYTCTKTVDYIINNAKTGMCPMESKFKNEPDIQKIYDEVIN